MLRIMGVTSLLLYLPAGKMRATRFACLPKMEVRTYLACFVIRQACECDLWTYVAIPHGEMRFDNFDRSSASGCSCSAVGRTRQDVAVVMPDESSRVSNHASTTP